MAAGQPSKGRGQPGHVWQAGYGRGGMRGRKARHGIDFR